MDVITLLGQSNAIGLVELIHERIISQFIESFLPAIAARADELSDVRSLKQWKICLDGNPARHAAFHKENLTARSHAGRHGKVIGTRMIFIEHRLDRGFDLIFHPGGELIFLFAVAVDHIACKQEHHAFLLRGRIGRVVFLLPVDLPTDAFQLILYHVDAGLDELWTHIERAQDFQLCQRGLQAELVAA